MNYGDGVYAGQFMGAMYAEGVFRERRLQAHRRGAPCHPVTVHVCGMVRDVLSGAAKTRTTGRTWALVDAKYRRDHPLLRQSARREARGRFVLMGLLYGGGDRTRPSSSPPAAARFRLQPLERCRRPVHQPRHAESAGPLLQAARRDEDLQPHRLQFPGLMKVCDGRPARR
jgi:hypothetical protein